MRFVALSIVSLLSIPLQDLHTHSAVLSRQQALTLSLVYIPLRHLHQAGLSLSPFHPRDVLSNTLCIPLRLIAHSLQVQPSSLILKYTYNKSNSQLPCPLGERQGQDPSKDNYFLSSSYRLNSWCSVNQHEYRRIDTYLGKTIQIMSLSPRMIVTRVARQVAAE